MPLFNQNPSGGIFPAVESSGRASPMFGKLLVGYLRMRFESHYFSPKWSFSWKAIKIEEIKFFTRLIRLHTSSGLISHKQENHKKPFSRVSSPGGSLTHHKALGHDKEEIGISCVCKLALPHSWCIRGKLEGHWRRWRTGLGNWEAWPQGPRRFLGLCDCIRAP